MTPISICVIAKNEEKNMDTFLTRIIKHTQRYPVEILIADTGSTDKTIEIIEKYPVKLTHFKWICDFSAARNYTLEQASNDWILVLDCDEYIEELDMNGLQNFISKLPNHVGVITIKNHYQLNGQDTIYTNGAERFFNRKRFHYEEIIHEQVRALNGSPITKASIPLIVDHSGYNVSLEELQAKVERNNELLFKMLEDTPDDPYIYFQIGQSYNMLHDDEKACYYYGKGLEFEVEPELEYVQMMVIGYGYALLHLECFEEALMLENIYEEFATSADFVCLMGLIYLRNGQLLKAMAEFIKATTMEKAHVEGANTYIPTFNMGCINELAGDINTAITYYKKCGSFKPALDRLKTLDIHRTS